MPQNGFYHQDVAPYEEPRRPSADGAASQASDGHQMPRLYDRAMLPHEFEQLWSELPPHGAFEAQVKQYVPLARVVNHLTQRGFAIMAAGDSGGGIKVLFYARKTDALGTPGPWFMGEFAVSELSLTLSAAFKSRDTTQIADFVKKFKLAQLFELEL